MEVRGDIGWYNPGTDEYTIWMSSQTPHIQRLLLAAFVMGVPEHKIRCISPDVGGAFGTKIFCYPDYALVLFASKALGGRPVKWIESRRENYQSTIHGRDHITHLEIAGTREGEITGLRVKTLANLGGRLSTIGPGIPTTLYARVLSGCYKIPNVYAEVTGVYTNTTFVDAYRGAGRPGGDLRHRAGDGPLRRRDRDGPRGAPAPELRPARPVPVREPVRALHRVGRRQDRHRFGQLRARHGQGARDGRLRRRWRRPRRRPRRAASSSGVGLSTYIEVCGVAPSKWIGAVGEGWGAAMWESANIKMHLTGKTVVTMGTQPQGQGHETTYSQIISHELGIPMEDIVVQHSRHPGHAVRLRLVRLADLVGRQHRGDQGRRQDPREGPPDGRPHARGVAPTTSRSTAPNYFVKGSPDRVKTIQEIAFAIDLAFDPPEGMEPYLDETAYYDTPNCTWPFGTHIAIVEIDEETGHVELVRYVAVDDVGKKINPMIVDGQLHGGIAQGVGQALWEGAIYDDEGQLLTGLDARLHDAAGVVLPEPRARRDRHPVTGQPDRGQGRRRGGRDREHGGGGQRRRRRAQPAGHPPSRHAVHAADRVARDADREGRPGVIPAAFEYQRPASIEEALAIIASDPGAKVLAGGQSLLPLLKLRLGSAETLVDIGRLPGLRGVRRLDDGRLAIGALTTYAELLDSPARNYGLLGDALPDIGDVQVRNRGTIGGADRPRRPGLGPAGLPARARCRAGHPLGRRRADDRRSTGSSTGRSRPASTRASS